MKTRAHLIGARLTSGLALALLGAQTASAQTGFFDVSADKAETYASVGGAVLSRPLYLGSEDSETSLLPYVDAEYKGRFYIKPVLGAGIHAVNNDWLRVSAGVGFLYGRDVEDSDTLSRLNQLDIDDALTVNIGARLNMKYAVLDILSLTPMTGDAEGSQFDISLITQLDPTDKLRINPGIRATAMTEDMINQRYGFRPRPAASTNERIKALTPDRFTFTGDGTQSVSAFVAGYYQLGSDYEIIGIANYSQLVDPISDSRVVETKDGATFSVALARKF